MSAANRTTEYEYTLEGQLAVLTARNAETGDQVTRWHYGTTLADSGVASNSLLRAKVYPDSDDEGPGLNGPDTIYDRVEYRYNRQGELIEQKDQNETVHAYEYDRLGQLTHDRVTALGTGIDEAVRRISRGYDRAGNLESVSSWSEPALGKGRVVNQVLRRYNGFGQLTAEYQSHDGPVGTSSTPAVRYTYADGSDRHIRRLSMTYPGGRELLFYYGEEGSADDRLGRIREIRDRLSGDSHPALARYTRRGLSATMQIEYPQCGGATPLMMTYIKQPDDDPDAPNPGGDQYTGQDQFNRIIDIRWLRRGTETHVDRIQYGFDRAGNRLWRKNAVAATDWDELYSYDGLYQLTERQRGTLNEDRTAIDGTVLDDEQFTFDPTGNWDRYRTLASGTETLDQGRTHNPGNEITTIDGSHLTVAYDQAGNTTLMPKVGDWNVAQTPIWDAWNRMVKLSEGDTTMGAYAYDGLTRRVWKESVEGGTEATRRHFYYSDEWQVLEERLFDWFFAERNFVWGLRYIDDLVLRDVYVGSATRRLFATHDQWHVIATVGDNLVPSERFAYRAFGQTRALTADFTPLSSEEDPWETTYGGYRFEAEAGFLLARHRILHPPFGRWLSEDPRKAETRNFVGSEDSEINLYSYVTNRCTSFADPSGLAAEITFEWESKGMKSSKVNITITQHLPISKCCVTIEFIQILRNAKQKEWMIDWQKNHGGIPKPWYPFPMWGHSAGLGNLQDEPGSVNIINPFTLWQEFESCAVCQATRKILGCIKWGHSFKLAVGRGGLISSALVYWVEDWRYPAGGSYEPQPPTSDFLSLTAPYKLVP
jgi:RHS repeat-associated protein